MSKILLHLKDGVTITDAPEGGVELKTGNGIQTIREVPPGTAKALLTLAAGGATREDLEEMAWAEDWVASRLPHYLNTLARSGFITWSVADNGNTVARLVPIGDEVSVHPEDIDPEQRYVLSRFAFSRRMDHTLVIETPLQPVRIELHGWLGAGIWGLAASPFTCGELCASLPGSDPETVRLTLQLFAAAGVIQQAEEEEGLLPEDRDTVLRQWEFHDLLFHSRSRAGRHDQPTGATYRFWGKIPPLPACKPLMAEEVIALEKPDLDRLAEEDYPFTLVLEERCSIRDYAPEPITLAQIGEFLYRAARVKKVRPPDLASEKVYETTSRPYPGGGACHELELYLTVGACGGLDRGLYHYDPLGHSLTRLCDENRYTESILKQAAGSAAQKCTPQVVVNITARFARLSWKYNAIAYAVVMKDVGVLYQTMYLVATAMELAPCALGGGHADWLCRAAGLDYREESPVGEFLLGSKRI